MKRIAQDALATVLGAAAVALALSLLAPGCGFQTALSRAHEGLKTMSTELEPRLAAECIRRANACKDRGVQTSAECPELVACRAWKQRYALGVQLSQRGLATCSAVFSDLKKAGVIK